MSEIGFSDLRPALNESRRHRMYRRWKWKIVGYYANDVKPPKKPGGKAVETVHTDDQSKDLEVKVFEKREDIGHIEVILLRPEYLKVW